MSERPSIYEFVGGYDSLYRLVDAFYLKVRADPLLAPVFEHFTDEHIAHVAVWLSEVFGGRARFTEELGGHHGLLVRHLGLGITEAQRARWAELMVLTAQESLPDDDALHRQFADYIDWGTRIALEVSQPGMEIGDEPGSVPRWGWHGLIDAAE